jgi:pimeloyl-ACP methyl ester carboxylesterase
MNRLTAGFAVAGLALASLAATTTANGAVTHRASATVRTQKAEGYTPPPIKWGRCDNQTLRSRHAQCGFLVVPLDYSNPSGTKIKLAVSRVKHTAKRYQGVMLVNPGGPGGSGLVLSILGEFVPGTSHKTYDWIGFDPRGVGSSKPSLSCNGKYFHLNRPPYVPKTPHLMNVWLRRSHRYADACAKAAGSELLGHVKTVDNARDMDSLRKALGQQKINYYGFSYGTYLGQVYATLFPNRVRRFVLDSNVDPRNVWYQANLNQDVAFDRNIKIYFRWLAAHHKVYHLGKTGFGIQHRFYRELHVLTRHPAGGVLGPDELTDVFLGAGYYVYDWDTIARAYANLMHHGRAAALVRLMRSSNPVGPGQDNGYAMYLATECTDASWPSWQQQAADNWRIYRKHRFETWDNGWFNAPCSFWHAKSGTPVQVTGKNVKSPVLLIDETNDAATPYEGSLEVRSLFPTSSLIEGVGGTTHAGSLSGVSCVDNAVARYLANGTVPARKPGRRSDKRCPPVPPPTATKPRGARMAAPLAPLRTLGRLG